MREHIEGGKHHERLVREHVERYRRTLGQRMGGGHCHDELSGHEHLIVDLAARRGRRHQPNIYLSFVKGFCLL
jgi:hypothetical protein